MNGSEDFAGKTPRELGYHMPAEWEKHDAIWLAWPHDPTTFPLRVDKAEEAYVQIIKHIHESERVNLLVTDDEMKQKAICMLSKENIDLNRIIFHVFDYADVWFRDYGPTFVINKQRKLGMVNWIFNSWGEKYEELLKDQLIADYIHQKLCLPSFKPGIILEGGSIDVNGAGTVLTTEQCLLNRNRNPSLGRGEIEDVLKNHLNVDNVIWLKNGIVGDDTDGHVDDIARFVNPTTVVCAFEEDKTDENYAALKENYEILLKARDQHGRKLRVIKLLMPAVFGDKEERLPASYANFYIANDVVLVPVFNHKNDQLALSIIQEQFPDRKVAGINCVNLVFGLGAIHCITQQQPSAFYE